MRHIVISDVHGCIEELDELLKLVGFKAKGSDKLYFAGDLVDRGPDSVGCVRRVKELGAFSVLGNHDEKYIRYAKHEHKRKTSGNANPMNFNEKKIAIFKSLSSNDLDIIRSWPYYLYIRENLALIHGGLEPNRSFKDQSEKNYLKLRFVDKKGRFFKSLKKTDECEEWSKLWTGPESIICGHFIRNFDYPQIDVPQNGVSVFSLDTGACFGGHLTAMIIYEDERIEFARVKAKTQYAPLWND